MKVSSLFDTILLQQKIQYVPLAQKQTGMRNKSISVSLQISEELWDAAKIITLVTHSTLLLFFTATGFPFPHPAPDWAVRSAFPVTLGCMQCLQHQRSCAGAGHPVAVLRGQRGQRSPSDLQIMVLEVH